jgi:hypothetical protein
MAITYYAVSELLLSGHAYSPGDTIDPTHLAARANSLLRKGLITADGTVAGADDDSTLLPRADGMVVVNHGATASTARPTGVGAVYWIGSVEPTNALTSDMWWSE